MQKKESEPAFTAKVCVDGMRFFFFVPIRSTKFKYVHTKCKTCGKGTACLHKWPLDLAMISLASKLFPNVYFIYLNNDFIYSFNLCYMFFYLYMI